jgi:hypothetical protein
MAGQEAHIEEAAEHLRIGRARPFHQRQRRVERAARQQHVEPGEKQLSAQLLCRPGGRKFCQRQHLRQRQRCGQAGDGLRAEKTRESSVSDVPQRFRQPGDRPWQEAHGIELHRVDRQDLELRARGGSRDIGMGPRDGVRQPGGREGLGQVAGWA